MALPTPPYNPSAPIPNNPFYSDPANTLQGSSGPLIVGSGLSVSETGVISSTGGGGGGVTNVDGILPIIVATGTTTPVISINAATAAAIGAVQLATSAEVAAGVNSTHAVTPDTLASFYMPRAGGTFTGPVVFSSSLTANGVTRINGALTTTSTVTNCGAVTNCNTVTTAGATTNIGPVTNCALVTNCNNVVTCGTTTNVGQVTNCALVTNCNNVVTCGTTTNVGNVTNCGTTTMCGPTTFCNNTTFTCPSTFCCPVTFCTTPITPPGVSVGCALCVTYDNTTSGLAAANVQAAIDEVNTKTALPATTTTLGVVCVGSNINVTGAGQISVNNACYTNPTDTTSVKGAVQIYNALDASAQGCALDACQGVLLQSQITALAVTGGVSLAGTIDASNSGKVCSVTSGGSGAGFVVGNVLPAASATTNNYYVIVTTAGTFTPPGGAATAATQGDWFLVAEPTPGNYAWEFLNVGFDAPLATTASTGVVQLATDAQAQAGTDTANAVTSAALQSKLSDSVSTTSSSTIASSTAVKTAYDLANAAIPKSAVTGKGALVSGTAASTISTLAVGANGQMLVACGTATTGLCWINQPAAAIPCATILAKGDIVIGSAAATPAALTVGTNSQMLVACSTALTGLCWVNQPAAAIPCATLNAVGALVTTQTGSVGTPVALPVGANGTVLTACSAATTGLCWAPASVPAIPCACITGCGALVTGTAAGTVTTLARGTAGQVLTVDNAAPNGIIWCTPCSGTVTSVTAGAGLTGGIITTSGTIALPTTAVTPGSYTNANLTVDAYGRLTAVADGTAGGGGTVTSVATGTGLTGGPVTTTGTISLANTAVTAGSYTYGCFTVDAQGRLTAAGNGPAPVPCSAFTAKGDILGGTGAGTYSALTVGANGRVLAANSACTAGLEWITPCAGTVTSVATGTGLTGGPVTGTGTIALANTAVTAGSYTNSSITVDAQGRLTAASSGTAPVTAVTGTAPIAVTAGTTPVVSIAASSTTGTGAVQLYDGVDSTSDTLALTAAQGKVLQDQITTLATSGGLTLAGTFDAATSQMLSVTSSGSGAGFVVGDDLPPADAGNTDYFVLVTEPGSYTPPGAGGPILTFGTLVGGTGYTPGTYLAEPLDGGTGNGATADITVNGAGVITAATLVSGGTGYNIGDSLTAFTPTGTPWSIAVATVGPSSPSNVTQGDWFLSNGVTWQFLNVGPSVAYASTTTAGSVCLSTNALAQAGTDTLTALTPAAAASAYVPKACITAKGDLITGTAASTPVALTVGTDGQALVACSTAPNGICWGTVIPEDATPTVAGIVKGCTTGTLNNISLGGGPLTGITTGCCNTAVGYNAFCVNNSGNLNVVVGVDALKSNSTGSSNTAIGPIAMSANTTGGCNVGVGFNTLQGNTACSGITAVGSCALMANNGASNVAVGFGAAQCNTTGGCNTAVGTCALLGNLTGNGNTAVGMSALRCSTGTGNSAVGHLALLLNTGSSNTAMGQCVAICNTTGASLSAFGFNALQQSTSGFANSAFGAGSLQATTSGQRNAAIGYNSLVKNTTGSFNVGLGDTSLGCNTTGGCNVGVGYYTYALATTGCLNVAVGYQAGCGSTAGNCNTVIGANVQLPSLTGDCQLALGYGASSYWLTGCSTGAIKPGAGIIDCAGCCGTAGQVLMSNGSNAICWGAASGGSAATPLVLGTVLGLTQDATTLGTGLGAGALKCITTGGIANVAIGYNAGCLITTGPCNTLLGAAAGDALTTGSNNTGLGYCSLSLATATANATAVGSNAMCAATGGDSTAVGFSALCGNSASCGNTAVGSFALATNGGGGLNVAVGFSSLRSITTGERNVGVGENAGRGLTSGSCNVSVGSFSLCNNSSGTFNTAVGFGSIFGGNGSGNTALGSLTLYDLTTGSGNTAVGCSAGRSNSTAANNTFVGNNAGYSTSIGGSNTAVGVGALQNNTAGINNTALGFAAGCVNTGCLNVFIGSNAGCATSGGNQNVVIGNTVNVSGSCLLAIGFAAGCHWLTGNSTKAIRPGAGIIDCAGCCGTAGQVLVSTGANGICWGSGAAATPTVLGSVFGITTDATLATTALGQSAGNALTTGVGNVIIGQGSGELITTGPGNTVVGRGAGSGITTGCYNQFIGILSGYNTATGNCNVAIGPGVVLPVANGSCQLALGWQVAGATSCYWLTGDNTKAIKPGAGIIDCASSCGTVGQYLWTTGSNAIIWASSSPSDTRDKEILGPVPTALPVITQIEPITYKWKDRETNEVQEEVVYGFSAQQLQEVDPLLVDAQDEEHLRIFDKKIVPLLVQAVKELSAEVQSLRTELNELKK